MWSHLSQLDIAADDPSYSEVVRRVVGRLGDYAALVVRPLNMRPTGASLLSLDPDRVEVRISSPSGSVVLVVGADADMAGELFWLRSLAARNLPVPRLIAHDLSGADVPFCYIIQGYVSGALIGAQEDDALARVAARAVGRIVRRMHQAPAPGFGRPSTTGRWLTLGWPSVLRIWLDQAGILGACADLLGPALLGELLAETVDHPELACDEPRMLHSALGPCCARITPGEHIQLEALVRHGPLVAGDPLLDVAMALLPTQQAPFRQGFLDGYAAVGPLDPAERLRLRRYGLLALMSALQQAPELADPIVAELRAVQVSAARDPG
jgi:Phosphotransferase enzyme family